MTGAETLYNIDCSMPSSPRHAEDISSAGIHKEYGHAVHISRIPFVNVHLLRKFTNGMTREGGNVHLLRKLTNGIIVLFMVFAFLIVSSAHAACTNPAGSEAEIIYNHDFMVNQYCDGTDWIPMGVFSKYFPNAVTFDGTNDYLLLSSDLTGNADSKKVTGSFWFRRNSTGSTQAIFWATGGKFFSQFINTDNIEIVGRNTATTRILKYRTATSISDSNWHHMMFSIDMGNSTGNRVYIDGAQDSFTVVDETDDEIDFTVTAHSVGAITDTTSKFDGDMADLWLDYGTFIDLSDAGNRALFYDSGPVYLGSDGSKPTGTAPEIFLFGDTSTWHTNDGTGGGFTENGALTDAGTSPRDIVDGLVGYWKLDETSGTTAYDSFGSNDGTMNGGLDAGSDSVAGRVSTALDFDGTDDYVNTGQDLFNTHQSGTITAWIKMDDTSSKNIIHAVEQSHSWRGSAFYVNESGELSFWNRNGSSDNSIKGNTILSSGTWYHVAISSNGSSYKMYVDGADEGVLTGDNDGYWFGDNTSTPNTYLIGKIIRSGGFANGYFDGQMDDVRIYDRALSATEIANLARKCSNPHGLAGKIIYNSDESAMQYCNGEEWVETVGVRSVAPSVGEGYFVLTNSTYDGNLGEYGGARNKCYAELTSGNWTGKSDAKVNDSTVDVFLCRNPASGSSCISLAPNTTYNFAVVGDLSAGGASFTTDSNGYGPGDNANWSGATYFNGSYKYWIGGRKATSTALWGDDYYSSDLECPEVWDSNSNANVGKTGSSNATDATRWQGTNETCDQSFRLICIVHPQP